MVLVMKILLFLLCHFFIFKITFVKISRFQVITSFFHMKTKCQHNKPLYFLNLHSISFPTVYDTLIFNLVQPVFEFLHNIGVNVFQTSRTLNLVIRAREVHGGFSKKKFWILQISQKSMFFRCFFELLSKTYLTILLKTEKSGSKDTIFAAEP